MKTISEYVHTLPNAELDGAHILRAVPTSFMGTSSGVFFDEARAWHSGHAILSETSIETAIVCTPQFWQMEIIAHDILRKAKIVPCYLSPGNIPLARAALKSLPNPGVVTAGFHAATLGQTLVEASVGFPKTWILIHDVQSTSWDIPYEINMRTRFVSREIHLFPTIMLLHQCVHAALEHSGVFHLNTEFTWNISDSHTSIVFSDASSETSEILLPISLRASSCICGKSGVQRI